MFSRIFRRGRSGRRGQGQGFGRGFGNGRGFGGGEKPGSGPAGNCICPKCGYSRAHVVGERCMDQTCPKCGTRLTRE